MSARFIKRNNSRFADALICEARGLEVLRAAIQGSGLRVPDLFRADAEAIEMERISPAPWSDLSWEKLGQGLAHLHRQSRDFYGFEEDNYIGLNPQKNLPANTWGAFFVENRLGFQLDLVANPGVREEFNAVLSAHQGVLVDYLDACCDYPSLVHGDLWSGNVLCDERGQVWLIDPAVYFGDREVDMAMSEMFGGFHERFYRAYDEVLPRSPNYPVKRTIYNLYHYLNHYNLFGASYLPACRKGFALIATL